MFRSATTRLILVHLALLAVLTGIVLGSLYWRVGGVIDAEQRAVVETEVRGFTDDYARGGIPALAVAIERRLASPTDRDAVYLLAPATGDRIAGNLGRWPPTVAPDTGWATLRLYRTDRDRATDISALALRLPGGELLLVGRDVAARALFDRTLFRAVVWALVAIVLLTFATGWFLARLIRGHVTEIDAAARGIMAGALDRRVPTRGTGDEFDGLAATLNAMLDRIEALVSDLRMVTDSLAHDLRQPARPPRPRARGRRRRDRHPRRPPRPHRAGAARGRGRARHRHRALRHRPDRGRDRRRPVRARRPRPRRRRRRRALRGRRGGAGGPARRHRRARPRRARATTSSSPSRSPTSSTTPCATRRREAPSGRRAARRRRARRSSSPTAAPASPRPTASARSAASSVSTPAAAAPAPASASPSSPPSPACTAPPSSSATTPPAWSSPCASRPRRRHPKPPRRPARPAPERAREGDLRQAELPIDRALAYAFPG